MSLLNLYKYTILFELFFFLYSSDLAPLKNKNKSSIKQVKGLQKNFLQPLFFFFFFLVVYFCFVIVWSDVEVKEKQISSYELII